MDNKETFESVEEWASGSKLVILSVSPLAQYDWYILNESLGHWFNGVWFSNNSYKPYYTYKPKTRAYCTGPGYNNETTRGNYSLDRDDDDDLLAEAAASKYYESEYKTWFD